MSLGEMNVEIEVDTDELAMIEEAAGEVQREEERGTKDWETARRIRVKVNKEIHDYVCDFCGGALNEDAIRSEDTPICPRCARCPDCGDTVEFTENGRVHDCEARE